MENERGNTREWTKSYLQVNKISALLDIRTSFQKKAFFDYIQDPKMNILDVGCGSGGFIKLLEENGYENVYGVEPNEELLKRLDNPKIKQGFSTSLPFEDLSFDCIYFFNVLHHLKNIEDYHQTVRETDRCLKLGGFVIMVEPCNKSIYSSVYWLTKLLSPVSETFVNFHQILTEEKEDLTYFFGHYKTIKENLLNFNYQILRDHKLFHQWTFVVKKISTHEN